jgi:hypothetical protein
MHARQSPVRPSGPVMSPGKAGMRDEAPKPRPARIFLVW